MKKLNFKGGIGNPLNSNKICFRYEVVKQGEVSYEEYDDQDGTNSYPVCPVILKFIGGSYSSNELYCQLGGYDAQKILRPGELVSAELNYYLKQNEDGSYKQTISASDVYTLNDYQKMREAEAHYEGSLKADRRETA